MARGPGGRGPGAGGIFVVFSLGTCGERGGVKLRQRDRAGEPVAGAFLYNFGDSLLTKD